MLKILVRVDDGLIGISTSTSVRWADSVLEISADSRRATAVGQPGAVRYDGGRIVRDLPDEVAA